MDLHHSERGVGPVDASRRRGPAHQPDPAARPRPAPDGVVRRGGPEPPTRGSATRRWSPRELGVYGERLAVRHLVDSGMTVLDRNWRCARGELDIVALDGPELVVCEVKTRTSEAFGAPFEAVTWRKLRRLRGLAGLWRDDHPDEARGASLRIDVVSILRPPAGRARLQHLRGVC